jgi:transposase-like protein
MPKTPRYSKEFRAEAVRLLRAVTDGLTSDEREELRRLRRENLILAVERGILKKAAAFSAKDSETR